MKSWPWKACSMTIRSSRPWIGGIQSRQHISKFTYQIWNIPLDIDRSYSAWNKCFQSTWNKCSQIQLSVSLGLPKTIMTFSCFKSVFILMMLCWDTPFTSYCDKIVLREPLINVRRRIILMLQKVLNMFLKWHDVLHDGYIYGHHIYHIYIRYIIYIIYVIYICYTYIIYVL